MNTETKNLENSQVSLTVTADAAEMKSVITGVEKAFMRQAQMPGFRKGKIPLAIIRKEFAEQLKSEIIRSFVRTMYPAAIKSSGIDEVALVNIADDSIVCNENGGSFTAIVDVRPKFDVPAYKGLVIAPANTAVDEQEIAAEIARVRTQYATYEDAKEGETAANGDFAQIDYSGTVDGKPILEINPEAKVVANGTGFWFQMTEGRFLPEIIDAVNGMKAGETKEGIQAKFDSEAAPEGLKGVTATYTVTLKAFRRQILPTDEQLLEKTKHESMDKFAESVRDGISKMKIRQEDIRRENEAVEQLMKNAEFAVPETQVRRSMDNYLNELSQRAQYAGLTSDYFEQNREQILADARNTATRQVRLWYIIEAIAKLEGIDNVAPEEKGRKVLEVILNNAKA